MKAVHARRLLKLADFLETVPAERFDFSSWVGREWDGKTELSSCGTTACALGWATTMPMFRRLGLRLARDPIVDWNYVTMTDYKGIPEYAADEVAGRLFGLSPADMSDLFTPCECGDSRTEDEIVCLECDHLLHGVSAHAVAANIRRFVYEQRSAKATTKEGA